MMAGLDESADLAAFRRRLARETGLTPYGETRRWKHRFWYALGIDLALSAWILRLYLRC
jgi:hypothetical protein